MAYFGWGFLVAAVLVMALGFSGVVHGAGGVSSILFLTSFALLIGSTVLPHLHMHRHHHPH